MRAISEPNPDDRQIATGSSGHRMSVAHGFTERWSTIWPPALALIIVLIAWQLLPPVMGLPAYILPKPSDVLHAAIANWNSYSVAVLGTCLTAIGGFLLSAILGILCGVLMASFRAAERVLYPYAIVLNTVPIIAVAPLIIIWFGTGTNAILAITFIIGFFPVVANSLVGLHSASTNSVDLFRVYHASRWQTMLKLRFPSALPYIMTGLKIACTLAVVGTIVGEYVGGAGGGEGGLGYVLILAIQQFQTAYVFAVATTAALFGIAFYLVVNLVSIRVLGSWHESAMDLEP